MGILYMKKESSCLVSLVLGCAVDFKVILYVFETITNDCESLESKLNFGFH